MNGKSPLALLRKVGVRGAMLLAEAAFMLALSSAAIAMAPFSKIAGFLSRRHVKSARLPEDEQSVLRSGRWAVEAAARRLPWKTLCFQKGLAFHLMMRRRGIDTLLHYGVAQNKEKGIQAHVWISHAGRGLIGSDVAADFACLATYPPPDASGERPLR